MNKVNGDMSETLFQTFVETRDQYYAHKTVDSLCEGHDLESALSEARRIAGQGVPGMYFESMVRMQYGHKRIAQRELQPGDANYLHELP